MRRLPLTVFILIIAILVFSLPALAENMPCDANNDGRLTQAELSNAIISSLGAGNGNTDDVHDAAYIYAYWNGAPKSIVDSANRTITIYRPVKKISGLHTSPCREFQMLGIEDKVAAVTSYTWDDPGMYPRLLDKTNIGTIYAPDYEKIAAVMPDVLVTSTTATYLDPVIKKLEPMGIKVVALDLQPTSAGEEGYNTELRKLAYLTDTEQRASDFIDWRMGIFRLIKDRTANLSEDKRIRVSPLEFSGVPKGETDFSYSLAKRIVNGSGCIDLTAGLPSSGKVSGESILKQNPDLIVLDSTSVKDGFGYSVTNTTLAASSLKSARNHAVLSATNASKNGRMYVFSYYGLTSGGQTEMGALYLAKKAYPDLFSDVDPVKYQREYFENWLKIPYQGVWFYP